MVDLGVGRSNGVAGPPPPSVAEVAVPRPARAEPEKSRDAAGKSGPARGGVAGALREKRSEDVAAARAEAAERREQEDQLREPIEGLNSVMRSLDVGLRFRVNDDLNELFVQVVNEKDGSVVRQIPPDDVLKLRSRFREAIGLLLDRYV